MGLFYFRRFSKGRIYSQKTGFETRVFGNTLLLDDLRQNTPVDSAKMIPNGTFWIEDLLSDDLSSMDRARNACFKSSFFRVSHLSVLFPLRFPSSLNNYEHRYNDSEEMISGIFIINIKDKITASTG